MEILKIDQLSIAAQAGALDASLAFSSTYVQHQDLISQTAASGLRGLQEILSETGVYGQALRALQDVSTQTTAANTLAQQNPFVTDSSNQANVAVDSGRHVQSSALNPTISNAQNSANNAFNGTTNNTPERTAATTVQSAANGVANANGAFYNGDPSQVQSAYNAAISAQTQASTTLTNAQTNYNNTPASPAAAKAAALARLQQAQAVYNAANDTVNAATQLLNLRNTPIGLIAGVSPSSKSDLGNGYTLTTWGTTGITTLTDSSGKGIIISADGTVDPLDGAGEGWKFNNTSTFILPGDTKVTFNPGNPANVLVSRGIHAFTLDNIGSNRSVSQSGYSNLNGRVADRGSNDGYIISLNGDAAHWTLGGSVLGDAGSREVVATSFLNNELKLDPTDVSVSPETKSFIDALGLTGSDYDYDGDGKFNNEELGSIATNLTNYIRTLQEQYEQALAKLQAANDALSDLNDLLELLRKQNDKTIDGRSTDDANARGELRAVERKLLAALEALNGSGNKPTAGLQGGIEGGAQQVLQQLTTITQQGGLQTTVTTSSLTPTTTPPQTQTPPSTPGSPSNIETLGQPVNTNGTDPLGDSMRRASRLLSGLLGGGNLNILDLPPTSQTAQTGPVDSTTAPTEQQALSILEDLGASLATLVTDLNAQLGLMPTASVTGPNLSTGLDGMLQALMNAGLIDDSMLRKVENAGDLMQAILGGIGASARAGSGGSISPAALLNFLGMLAQLGAALQAVGPQEGQTTPGQPEKGSLASLTPLSVTAQEIADVLSGANPDLQRQIAEGVMKGDERFKDLARATEQLKLVLQGLADIGTTGSGQSLKNANAEPPTNAELSKGLQMFIAALMTFGLFSNSEKQQNPTETTSSNEGVSGITFGSDNRDAINTISGNFATDPELMKIIEANLNKALQVQKQQLHQASTLFVQSQAIVQKFVEIVKHDSLVHDVVKSDELSDEQQQLFDDRMKNLQKDWGIDWGGPEDNKTPAAQANLTTRAVQSGMMV